MREQQSRYTRACRRSRWPCHRGRGELDLIADLALPVPATVICEMLGVPAADRDRFTRWTAEATHGLAAGSAPPCGTQSAVTHSLERTSDCSSPPDRPSQSTAAMTTTTVAAPTMTGHMREGRLRRRCQCAGGRIGLTIAAFRPYGLGAYAD